MTYQRPCKALRILISTLKQTSALFCKLSCLFIGLEGAKGVPRNGGRKKQLVRSCFALNSSRSSPHVDRCSNPLPWDTLGSPSDRARPSRCALAHILYIHIDVSISLSLSLSLYIHIYIYIYHYLSLSIYIYIYTYT